MRWAHFGGDARKRSVGQLIPCCAGEQWSTRDPATSTSRVPVRVAHPRLALLVGPFPKARSAAPGRDSPPGLPTNRPVSAVRMGQHCAKLCQPTWHEVTLLGCSALCIRLNFDTRGHFSSLTFSSPGLE